MTIKEPQGDISTDLWRVRFTQELDCLIRISESNWLNLDESAVCNRRIDDLKKVLFR